MIVGCYSLDLYCDKDQTGSFSHNPKTGEHEDKYGHVLDEFPHNYTAELGSTCRARARADGWLLTRQDKAHCPKCSGKRTAEAMPAPAVAREA